MTDRTMSSVDMARTSKEWMRRYIEEPERFEREFQSVNQFISDTEHGREPSYGERCMAYQFQLLDELNGEAATA